MSRRTPGRRTLLAAAALVLAGCSGVPTSSTPRTVEPIAVAEGTPTTQLGPPQGADARTIVQDFLTVNAADPVTHATARKYLAPDARTKWSDATATIISNQSVSVFQKGQVTVSGRVVGTLNSAGVFSPSLRGTGDGGPLTTFTYRLARVDGQYRVTALADGLLLTTDQFTAQYRQRALYFFDSAHRYLVPDTRWSALSGNDLATWLMAQLAAGPTTDLRDALSTDTLPVQATSRRITATGNNPVRVEVPGASQLDGTSLRRLAAEISATVTDPSSSEPVVITDGGSPVPMPDTSGPAFTAVELYASFTPAQPAADVFFLRNGDVVRDDGKTLDGKLRDSPFFLSAIAVSRPSAGPALAVAGVTADDTRLVLGTETAGYRRVALRGELSRPTWAPGLAGGAPPEVWIGADDKLERITVKGNQGTPTQVSVPTAAGGGRIIAVRLSPEGSRIAIVIGSVSGAGQLYVGTVARTAGQVRVDLQAISPDGVTVDDVAWLGTQKLIAVGSLRGTGEPRIFETNVDGSYWTGRTIGSTLPGPPDSITVAIGQLAWVSVNDTVWQQLGRNWTSPGPSNQTPGDKPVYLE